MHSSRPHTRKPDKITVDLLRVDDYHENIYIRPLAYKSDEVIGVKLHGLHEELVDMCHTLRSVS